MSDSRNETSLKVLTESSPVLSKIYVLVIGVVVLVVIHQLRSVLFPFALAGMIAYALVPLASMVHRKGLSWKASSALVFSVLVLAGIGLLILVVPRVIHQLQELLEELPDYIEEFLAMIQRVDDQFFPQFNLSLPLRDFLEEVGANLPDYLARVMSWVAEFAYILIRILVIGIIITPFILYFFLADVSKIRSNLTSLVPRPRRRYYIFLIREIDRIVGSFIRGRILLSLFVGISAAVGLFIMGIEFPLVIGIIAGVADVIPYAGPIVGAIPALIFASVHSPMHVLAVMLLFGGINLIEGVYVLPRLMGKEMNLHPMTVLFAILVGGSLYGAFGLIVSIPVAGVIKVLLAHAASQSPSTRSQKQKKPVHTSG